MILQGVGNDDVFPGLLEAVAQLVEAPILAREPPGRGADQREPDQQNRADSDALWHRLARKQGGQMGDVVTKRLRGEKRDGGEQDNPGNQEKQPHRDVPTPTHIFAMIAIGQRNRDQGPLGLPDASGGRNPRLVASTGWWTRGFSEIGGRCRPDFQPSFRGAHSASPKSITTTSIWVRRCAQRRSRFTTAACGYGFRARRYAPPRNDK